MSTMPSVGRDAFFAGIGRYECIAFVTGFVLMAFELLASRILAPHIGSSTYVWTSIIGVMIAALALGYAVGGWIADKRIAVQDVAFLLILSAVIMAATLLMFDSVLPLVTRVFTDPRAAGVAAAVLLFMPASFLLGAISPYLARLRVTSLATTGRSVASLSALNSVGGIAGTFVTGFIFFSYIGARESLALLVVAQLACSWLLVPRHQFLARTVITGTVMILVGVELVPAAQASAIQNIDTPSSHYRVASAVYNGRDIKVLLTGPAGMQSGIYTDGSRELVFPYTRKMAEVVDAAPHKNRILMLGGGVFTLPEYLAIKYPAAQVDVVEIDPGLQAIATHHFGYTSPPNVRIIVEDARAFVRAATDTYDIILVDAYNELSVPFSLSTREFAQKLKEMLQPDGVVAVNIIGALTTRCAPLLQSLHGSYRTVFASSQLLPVTEPALRSRQNIIGVYGMSSLQWLHAAPARAEIPQNLAVALTDNYAPVEALVQDCH